MDKLKIYRDAVSILENLGHESHVQETYSGRCMYGEQTPAIVTDAPGALVDEAVGDAGGDVGRVPRPDLGLRAALSLIAEDLRFFVVANDIEFGLVQIPDGLRDMLVPNLTVVENDIGQNMPAARGTEDAPRTVYPNLLHVGIVDEGL
jgi:hypothetical protein